MRYFDCVHQFIENKMGTMCLFRAVSAPTTRAPLRGANLVSHIVFSKSCCRGGPVFKAHRPVYHSILGWREIEKEKKFAGVNRGWGDFGGEFRG